MTSTSSLTIEERQLLSAHFQHPRKLINVAVAKLYISYPESISKWQETGLVGAWVFYANEETRTLHLQLLDIQTSARLFSQQLYEDFQYTQSTPYFHTFEGKDCVLGVSFAMDHEANRFYSTVCGTIEKKDYRLRPGLFKKAWGRFVSTSASKKKRTPVGGAQTISAPINFRHDGHMGLNKEGQFELIVPNDWLNNNSQWKAFYKNELHLTEEEMNDPVLLKRVIEATASFVVNSRQADVRSKPLPVPPRPLNRRTMRKQLTNSQELAQRLETEGGVTIEPTDDNPHYFAETEQPEDETLYHVDLEKEKEEKDEDAGWIPPAVPPPRPPLLHPSTPVGEEEIDGFIPPAPAPVVDLSFLPGVPVDMSSIPQPVDLKADQKKQLIDRLNEIRERVQDSDSEEELEYED